MDLRENTPDHSPKQEAAKAPNTASLGSIPVSEHLRNLANQAVIQSKRDEVLRLIREHPTDNTLRLNYADLLESHPLTLRDQARAELIRLQVARGDTAPSSRESEILLKFQRDWVRELGHVRSVTWDRGFITGVTMAPRHFAQSFEPLNREPITELRIHLPGGSDEGGRDLQDAVRAPHFNSVERLTFWIASPNTLGCIEPLLGSPELKLREIHFEKFLGSHQELLEACSKLHYSEELQPQSNISLALGHIAITFGSVHQ